MTDNRAIHNLAGEDESRLEPFHAMEIMARAQRLEAAGREICHLEVGEPAAPPAPRVLEAVRAQLDKSNGYTHARGLMPLREAIVRYYSEQHDAAISEERVVVTTGSSAGFLLAFLGAFRPGAAIAVTRPGYPAYLNIIAALGLHAVEIPLSAENGWKLTGEALRAAYEATPFEGLLFASPANPTGASVDREGLGDIIAACRDKGVTLISDEIYHGLDFAGPSVSAAEFGDEAILINSFSKYYCMTGWRIGWMVLPEALLRRTEILQQNLFISAPTLSQHAALAAITERDYSEVQKAGYARNGRILGEGLSNIGFGYAGTDGAFYAYADVSAFTNDSMGFCERLLDEAGVAATPGRDFDRVNGHRYVRFSFAGSEETMHKALERIAGFVRK